MPALHLPGRRFPLTLFLDFLPIVVFGLLTHPLLKFRWTDGRGWIKSPTKIPREWRCPSTWRVSTKFRRAQVLGLEHIGSFVPTLHVLGHRLPLRILARPSTHLLVFRWTDATNHESGCDSQQLYEPLLKNENSLQSSFPFNISPSYDMHTAEVIFVQFHEHPEAHCYRVWRKIKVKRIFVGPISVGPFTHTIAM